MPATKNVTTRKARRGTPDSVSGGATTAAGGVAGATTAGPAGGPIEVAPGTLATSAESGFGVLGWFTIDTEGCVVQFGIDQQQYALDASAANYNALFSMLLACWLEQRKVNLTYAIAPAHVIHAAPDGPRHIVSLRTI